MLSLKRGMKMLKRILGKEHGLKLSLVNTPVYLCPSKKTKIEITAQNTTEYDMHLFLSFSAPVGVKLGNSEPDFFVPAEGKSTFVLEVKCDENAKIYMGTSIIEFKAADRVLEWQQEYELEIFTENVFKCCSRPNDFSADDEMLYSSHGRLYLTKAENACLQCACTDNEQFVLQGEKSARADVYVNGQLCESSAVFLEKGLNKICISCKEDGCFWFAHRDNEKEACLNTINPKYFL